MCTTLFSNICAGDFSCRLNAAEGRPLVVFATSVHAAIRQRQGFFALDWCISAPNA
jgi:hypothetical protein